MNSAASNIRLLLVDDEYDFLNSVTASLNRRGFIVTPASNGMEALSFIENQEFDAAVLDVKMPGIDGVELLRKLRQINPHLPVIMLTGHGNIPDAFESTKIGAVEYLSKPYDLDSLSEKVRKAVEGQSKSPPLDAKLTGEDTAVKISLLLVDDEEELLVSLAPVLRRRNFNVDIAQSGSEALRMAESKNYDVIVLDIRMPGMDGIETLKRLQEKKHNFEAIILTGHPSVANAFESIKQGAAEYLIKPPNIDDLTELIKKSYAKLKIRMADSSQTSVRDILERYPD